MINLSLNRKEFLEDFFEKKIFFKRNACKASITLCDVDEILYGINPEGGSFSIFHKNQSIAENEYVQVHSDVSKRRATIKQDVLYNYLTEGATVILNRLHASSYKVNEISKALSRFTTFPTVANGYLAFGNDESFGTHWDTHDVFAVQLIGRKRWRVYPPTFELPLAGQHSKLYKKDLVSAPIFDEILEEGDILYIPRGWWHTAIPLNEKTFHLAVGIHPYHNKDYIEWVVKNYLSKHLECRKSLKYESNLFSDIGNILKKEICDLNNFQEFVLKANSNRSIYNSFNLERHVLNKSYINDKSIISLNLQNQLISNEEFILINGFKINLDNITNHVFQNLLSGDICFSDLVDGYKDEDIKKIIYLLDTLYKKEILEIS